MPYRDDDAWVDPACGALLNWENGFQSRAGAAGCPLGSQGAPPAFSTRSSIRCCMDASARARGGPTGRRQAVSNSSGGGSSLMSMWSVGGSPSMLRRRIISSTSGSLSKTSELAISF